jgi:hypothetical protein
VSEVDVMPLVACPECAEDEALEAIGATDTGAPVIRCDACDHEWVRDTTLRCGLCGSSDLRYTPEPLWEKGRGDQRTPAGRIDQFACWSCGARRVTSGDPIPPS